MQSEGGGLRRLGSFGGILVSGNLRNNLLLLLLLLLLLIMIITMLIMIVMIILVMILTTIKMTNKLIDPESSIEIPKHPYENYAQSAY